MSIMKKPYLIHPFFFTIYPILFFYSHNIKQIAFSEIYLPLIIALGCTFLLLLISKLFLKNNIKSAIIVSIVVVIFFSFGHIHNMISGLEIARPRYLLPIFCTIFVCLAYFIIRAKTNLHNLTIILNVIAVSLFAFAFINIGYHTMFKKYGINEPNKNKYIGDKKANLMESENTSAFRDIYYIVLDGYANSSTLKEIYDNDNREFTDYLTEKGFYIASKSLANYAITYQSLSSSLNMKYLDDKDIYSEKTLIRDSEVRRFIKSKGYNFVNINSGWSHTDDNEFADLNIQTRKWKESYMELIKTTILFHFMRGFFQIVNRHMILVAFDELAEIHKIEGPKFVFAHILCPHPPYVFGANGELVPQAKLMMYGSVWGQKKYYVNQLIFLNKKVKILVNEILRKYEVQPIIILQADHGTESTFATEENHGWNNPSAKGLRERMRIFNAYYLPPNGSNLLYESITPVNTFRLIFDTYFNSSYGLLNDRSYFASAKQPNKLMDVTSKVIFD